MRTSLWFSIAALCVMGCSKKSPLDHSRRYAVVEAERGLNIRSQPGTDARILATIPFGHFLEITREKVKPEVIQGRNGYWAEVKAGDISGFAFDGYYRTTMALARNVDSPSPLIGMELHEGYDCGGITYSEYGGTLELKDGKVDFHRLGASMIECKLKDPATPVGYSASFSLTKRGTYKITGNRIAIALLTMESVTTPSSVCADETPIVRTTPISESYTGFSIECTDSVSSVPGLIVPGLGENPGLIWVQLKRDP